MYEKLKILILVSVQSLDPCQMVNSCLCIIHSAMLISNKNNPEKLIKLYKLYL